MKSAIDEVGPLPAADRSRLLQRLTTRRLSAGDHLLRPGDPCRALGAVRHGVMREFYALPSGVQRTKAFAVEGQFVGSLPDALCGGASVCGVVAETEVELQLCSAAAFLDWMHSSDGTRRWGLALLERLVLTKARRERELVSLDAWGRYQAFRLAFPTVEARVSQRVVASYVGISPEHLSRLRSRQRRPTSPSDGRH
ncbi:MAG: Crp/Fnr family transcriptional regulator [Myxococcales bacterium]|nr:Crp/Fnr family transcriptional regulator [Myxococcales bacterium]